MRAPVDVLAVMDDRIEQARSRAGCRSDKPEPIGITEFREARAAVAELIAENDRLRIKANNWDSLVHARETTAAQPEDVEWKRLARGGELIPAVKACRTATGLSLREAKDCVEGYLRSRA